MSEGQPLAPFLPVRSYAGVSMSILPIPPPALADKRSSGALDRWTRYVSTAAQCLSYTTQATSLSTEQSVHPSTNLLSTLPVSTVEFEPYLY
ncbi:hypothetical protein YC2023_114374 [Brassica napus]